MFRPTIARANARARSARARELRARAQDKKFCASSARARAARWVNLMVIFQWTWTFTISDNYWSFTEVFEEKGLHICANANAREENWDSMERRRSRKVEKEMKDWSKKNEDAMNFFSPNLILKNNL